MSFRSNDERRPSKFIVLADNMKSAIKTAWEHGGADFQSRFDKSTGQAEQMKEGRFAFCEPLEETYFGDSLDSIGDLRVYTPRPMLQWFYLTIKYRIWSLPKEPAELRKLAFDLQVPLVHAWTTHGLDTSLLQSSIRERLRKDASYVILFLVIIFFFIVLFVFLLAWISRLPSLDLAAKYRPPAMTILEALAILESAVLECKTREVNTPELRAALDFLEPYIQPAWLIPQFRKNLDGEREHDYSAREGQQQVFRVTFPGIRASVRELLGQKMDALARKFAATHDIEVKDEIECLARVSRGCSPKIDAPIAHGPPYCYFN